MKIHSLSISLYLCVSLLCSCDNLLYEPSAKNVNPMAQPEPDMDISFTDSTFRIPTWGVVSVDYYPLVSGKKVALVECYIDSTLIYQSERVTPVTFDTREFADGIHQLVLAIYVHSESGSLADRLELEYFYHIFEKPIFIENTLPDYALEHINVVRSNGQLHLEWDQYPASNFESYEIYQIHRTLYRRKVIHRTHIPDRTVTRWTDTKYLGGEIIYKIVVNARGEQVAVDSVLHSETPPRIIETDIPNDSTITLIWSQVNYPANFHHYELQKVIDYVWEVGPDAYYDFETIYTTESIADTAYVDTDAAFGNEFRYRIITRSPNDSSVTSQSITARIGYKCPSLRKVTYSPGVQRYYLLGSIEGSTENYYSILDAGDYSIVDSIGTYAGVNTDASRMFKKSGHMVYELDPVTLNIIENRDISGLFDISPVGVFDMMVGGNCLLFLTIDSSPNILGYYVYDFAAGEMVAWMDRWTFSYIQYFNQVSRDGNYIFFKSGRLLQVLPDTLLNIGYISDLYFTFLGEDNRIANTRDGTIQILECPSLQAIESYPVGGELYYPDYDRVTGYLGAIRNDDTYMIFDFDRGEIIKEIPLTYRMWLDRYYLENGHLWSRNGYVLPLDFQ